MKRLQNEFSNKKYKCLTESNNKDLDQRNKKVQIVIDHHTRTRKSTQRTPE